MKDLTTRQREIYDWMLEFFLDKKNQRMPTYDEIGDRFGITSKASIHSLMRCLEKKGVLRIDPRVPGSGCSTIKFADLELCAVRREGNQLTHIYSPNSCSLNSVTI